MLKKLFYKKKFIIFSLSAILTLLIVPNSAKALTYTNYKYNGFDVPDPNSICTDYPSSCGGNVYMFFRTSDNRWTAFVTGLSNNVPKSLYGGFYSPSSGNLSNLWPIYSSGNLSSRTLAQSGGGCFNQMEISNGVWTRYGYPCNSTQSFGQYTDLVYNSSPLYYGNLSDIGVDIGYHNVTSGPNWSISADVMKYDSNYSLYNELDLVVSEKNLDNYIYDVRVQSFDGTSWITDWSSVDWYYNSTHIHLVSYSNFRYWLRIRDKSTLDVVYEDQFVVSSFYNSNYKEYYLNSTDIYYYVSGFTNQSSNVVIAPNVPFRWSDVVYYDFTTGLIVKDNNSVIYPSFEHCSINNISYDVCISVDFVNDIPSYDSTHTYGLQIQNQFSPIGLTNISNNPLSYNDTSFFVLNSLYVSSGASFSISDGGIVDNSYDYSDSNGDIHSSSGLDSSLTDYDTLSFALNESSAHYSNFFRFISLGFSAFFSNLSNPLAFAWIFCFTIVIVALCIKFFY